MMSAAGWRTTGGSTFLPTPRLDDLVAATHALEQLIRSYDPCISCATHFLDLSVERRVSP